MKYCAIAFILLMSCTTLNVSYFHEETKDPQYYVDSIANIHNVYIPNIDQWKNLTYYTSDSVLTKNYQYIIEDKKELYILSAFQIDSIYYLKFRLETTKK